MSRRRDTIPSRWRQLMSRDLVCRCRPRGDGLPFDFGRAFKRHRQSGWAPGVRRADWAFAPLAAARGTSTLSTGGSCTYLRRWADQRTTGWTSEFQILSSINGFRLRWVGDYEHDHDYELQARNPMSDVRSPKSALRERASSLEPLASITITNHDYELRARITNGWILPRG